MRFSAKRWTGLSLWLLAQTSAVQAWAATSASLSQAPSTSDSLGRMVFGTLVVLLVMAGIAWLVKRLLPGHGLSQRGVISQVGGLALGPRERVVVLEVAGRWLVVGIQPGQMTALGEVTPPADALSDLTLPEQAAQTAQADHDPHAPNTPFAQRLQHAMQTTLQDALHKRLKSRKNAP